MTDKEINITISAACGWDCDPIEAHDWNSRGQWCVPPNQQHRVLVSKRMNLPSYATDLNAMHDAEKALMRQDLFGKYCAELEDVCEDTLSAHVADARQRAEAFLRTIGKWAETEVTTV